MKCILIKGDGLQNLGPTKCMRQGECSGGGQVDRVASAKEGVVERGGGERDAGYWGTCSGRSLQKRGKYQPHKKEKNTPMPCTGPKGMNGGIGVVTKGRQQGIARSVQGKNTDQKKNKAGLKKPHFFHQQPPKTSQTNSGR